LPASPKGGFLPGGTPISEAGAGDEIRTHDSLLGKHLNEANLLNKYSVSQLAELSKLSKSYISQVKKGIRPPSQRLLSALTECIQPSKPSIDYFKLFLQSRQAMGVSPKTLIFYKYMLYKFICQVDYVKVSRQSIEKYLNSIPPNHNGLATRHATFRALKTFYRWLKTEYGIPNPIDGMKAPILGKPIMPSLSQGQVLTLLDKVSNPRDKAIIALFVESGLRLAELTEIKSEDIYWESRVIKVIGKGRKEAYAPFGELSELYLRAWLIKYRPNGYDNIWGLNLFGIRSMLKRLQVETGLPCNPHTFRRTFACLLRKAGVDTMTIKDLGRWESLEMVQRYTRSVTFEDSMKHYKAPLS